jgi:hypothetical protein
VRLSSLSKTSGRISMETQSVRLNNQGPSVISACLRQSSQRRTEVQGHHQSTLLET